ncbi:hypothetical protein TREMEDRAFT_41904 [Tremella mesenterica DSM 1558]|uniref:uncharacterized protein n=1 Tax=Tremella mesenterica (strain ATCC 24925 / CBS 8224 / DSM 1558 / NBRC 9311 / NRRL Y-6157 / RJB 2259-6 / UBC 559-6) TaxID=578456 RepID=UPI0003F493B5|nr:uncharacterized protein TREMEDRAFT_41904 [Tremella mesenterica DSM 1558]EIW72673.1 hypothetical protein TREMEDRAFT_41904 [Tremella mesenterica DSM 1558]
MSQHNKPPSPKVPPFPPQAIHSDDRRDHDSTAEDLINIAATHIMPVPAPSSSNSPQDKRHQVQAESEESQVVAHARDDREEEPIMAGTPLDELKTPTLERLKLLDLDPETLQPPTSGIEPTHVGTIQEDDAAGDADDEAADELPTLSAPARLGLGTSALISALHALPWDDEEDEGESSSNSSDIEARDRRSPEDSVPAPTKQKQQRPKAPSLQFPFRANTIARRARSPGLDELQYQFAKSGSSGLQAHDNDVPDVPPPKGAFSRRQRQDGDQSSESSSLTDNSSRRLVARRIEKEEHLGAAEEHEEILRTLSDEESDDSQEDVAKKHTQGKLLRNDNTEAALREDQDEEMLEERMSVNPGEKKRVRKERLAERLQEVFGLEEREEVLEELRCWLLRSVMLKGYMYLTPRHICFFAQMPNKENVVVKTGPLYKKATRTKLNSRFWVTLKNDVLSWYESTSDPYFPKGNVSLQYAFACEPVDDTRFKLRTSERTYTFSAETQDGRDDWVKAIKRVMFKTQHEGESVKLIIPLEVVLEVERSPSLEFAETIEIKCVDLEDQMSVDSYFFASFHDLDHTINVIQRLLDARPPIDFPRVDSDLVARVAEAEAEERARSASDSSTNLSSLGSLRKLGSVLKPFVRSSDKVNEVGNESHSRLSLPSMPGLPRLSIPFRPLEISDEDMSEGYPPRQSGPVPAGLGESPSGWAPSWVRKPTAKLFGSSPSSRSFGKSPESTSTLTTSPARMRSGGGKKPVVTEVVEPVIPFNRDSDDSCSEEDSTFRGHGGSGRPRMSFSSDASIGSQMGDRPKSDYSMMEQSMTEKKETDETRRKFLDVFSLPDTEELLDHFPGYLYRVLPVSGRFFISTNYFCFRSSQLLYKTKMIIPLRDLYGLKAQKAFRFGHSGLIVIIKGHEELFLEFSSSSRRKACITLLEERMEAVRLQTDQGEPDVARIRARIMEDLDESAPFDPSNAARPSSPSSLFESTASTLLEFKPESMRITCLTIGSRGDVQPYIALCKGLQAEGHTTRIASHGEYKEWVEGHGIEFASVGGDPAELMQMCVDNGMFTVSFLKEGLQKFRGWLDDLLTSSWKACQGSDLLIESPSAMGGIHIAEALRIPYYRAFTMPWTRTRAYPHAFAVPDHKRGGSYNYMTYTMFDQVFWRAIASQVNKWRKNTLCIESTTYDKLEQHKVPFLYNFSPSVVPPPLDWTEWIHVTGYWFLEKADEHAQKKEWCPPERLLHFMEEARQANKKVVYIGFGSIVVSDPEEMTRCVVDAVVESGVYAILSKGWSDRGTKAKDTGTSEGADGIQYPASIFAIDSIDHSWLFPRIDAACHHGGAGTTGASLRAGIPTIIKPFFGDQSFWAERVESLNVGSAVRKLTSETLASALSKATTDEKQIAKAKVVGEMIRRENGVTRAIEAIYRDLEYAKSLIKPLPEAPRRDSKSILRPLTSHTPDLNLFRSRSKSLSKASSHSPDSIELLDHRPTSVRTMSPVSERDHSRQISGGTQHSSDSSWSVVSDGIRF